MERSICTSRTYTIVKSNKITIFGWMVVLLKFPKNMSLTGTSCGMTNWLSNADIRSIYCCGVHVLSLGGFSTLLHWLKRRCKNQKKPIPIGQKVLVSAYDRPEIKRWKCVIGQMKMCKFESKVKFGFKCEIQEITVLSVIWHCSLISKSSNLEHLDYL